jgi:hypothetical protein
LGTEDDAVINVVHAAIGHIDACGRSHFDPFHGLDFVQLLRVMEFHPGYEDSGEVRALCCLEQVGGDVELIMGGDVDAGFVEEGIF